MLLLPKYSKVKTYVTRNAEMDRSVYGALLTLLTGVWIWSGHFHIVGGNQACDPIEFAFPPIRITFVQHVDDLILGEAELIPVGCCVVVYGDNLADCSETHRR